MLVIGTRCAYDRLTGDANTRSSMTDWTTKKDVTSPPAQAKSNERHLRRPLGLDDCPVP